MWRKAPEDSRTIWMDITARERHFTISLFGQGRGLLTKESQVLEEETYQNLREALEELTDPQRAASPEAFNNFGSLLFELALPEKIQVQLLKHDGPLVFSTHELSLPWELLCADDRYLCLKNPLSRQLPVLTRMQEELLCDQPISVPEAEEHSALIIANPTGDLTSAEDEAEELRTVFTRGGLRCDALIGPKDCTYANVMAARLRKHSYSIIHFAGHAEYLDQKGTSAILLADRRMILAQEIQRTFKGEPLVFLNACWSAMGEGGQRRNSQPGYSGSNIVRTLTEAFTFGNRSGRARAVIGSMWWIADDVARGLAGCFYQEVLAGHPLGEALRRARNHISSRVSDPALWSTYVLFGDSHQCAGSRPIATVPAVNQDLQSAVTQTVTCSDTIAEERSPTTVVPSHSVPVTPRETDVRAAAGEHKIPLDPLVPEDERPWSDEMRAAFVGAMTAMAAMHWKVFSTVHLILGLTYVENGLVAGALTRCGVNPQAARRTLRELFTVKDGSQSQEDSIISDNLKGVFSAAQKAARADGAFEVTESYVVSALLDRPDSGGTMMLAHLNVDLDDLRRRVSETPAAASVRNDGQSPVDKGGVSAWQDDLMLPNGDLDRSKIDDDGRMALEEATLMAYRSYWPDLRSPHFFLGILNRRGSRLADHLVAQHTTEPTSLATLLLTSLTKPIDASIRQPKLNREFLSENALLTLRTAGKLAYQCGRTTISERDLLAAILGNSSNVITSTLRSAGLDPYGLLWPDD